MVPAKGLIDASLCSTLFSPDRGLVPPSQMSILSRTLQNVKVGFVIHGHVRRRNGSRID